MKKLQFISILLFLVFSFTSAHAKKFPVKFGKVSDKLVKMTSYEADTSAVAVILCDYGSSEFNYTEHEGFNIHFSRLMRIKILKKEGYDWAKHEIVTYSTREKVSKLRANTYTLIDGKVEKIKLPRNQVYNEEINKYWDITKFEMPQVKVGSVIEIEYTINSDSYQIKEWYFQSEIPTVVSQYEVEIPEYFYYKQLEKGYFPITSKNVETKNDFISITQKSRSGGNVTRTTYQTGKIEFKTEYYTYRSENVPALYDESYSTTMKNYLSGIYFELGSTKFPNATVKNYTTTWKAIGKDLMKDEHFGYQLSTSLFLNKTANEIKENYKTADEQIIAAFEFIKSKMNWNKYRAIYSFDGLRHAYNNGNGNVADINLMLTALLQKVGINAHPVILSTRANGMVHPAQIMLEQFDYVITAIKTEDAFILLDATDKYAIPGLLPKRCLNDKGRMITKNGGDWINLNPNTASKKSFQADITVHPEGLVSGKVAERYENYAALNMRHNLDYFSSESEYIEDYQEKFQGMEISLDSVTNKNKLWKEVSVDYHLEYEDAVEQIGDLMMINPVFLIQTKGNPFKLEKRVYPVDYGYQLTTNYMAKIKIPEGYQVEELPKPQRIMLPEKSASYNYTVQNLGNQLVVVARFDINKTVFLPDEYDFLKQFYNLMIDAEAKKIVLKKI